jgi:hypothetical protein
MSKVTGPTQDSTLDVDEEKQFRRLERRKYVLIFFNLSKVLLLGGT